MIELRLGSLKDTSAIATLVSRLPLKGRSVGLTGPLGSGKTTFTRYLLSALGSRDSVSSPTFALCHEYRGEGLTVEHWDLYRLNAAPEELLESSERLKIIEWPERDTQLEQELDLKLSFRFHDPESEQERDLIIAGELAADLAEDLKQWR